MKQTLIYSLKVWLTSVALAPVIFVVLLSLMAILPQFQVPELIGFVLVVYLVPYAIYLSTWVSIGIFGLVILLSYGEFGLMVTKLYLSILAVILSSIGLLTLYNMHAAMISDIGFFLITAYITACIDGIWFYKLKRIQTTRNSPSTL